jgi:hypothetical protein
MSETVSTYADGEVDGRRVKGVAEAPDLALTDGCSGGDGVLSLDGGRHDMKLCASGIEVRWLELMKTSRVSGSS